MDPVLINGADIEGQRVIVDMEDNREVSLDFPVVVRRVTIYDYGKGMVVETVDGKITRYTAEQLIRQAKAAV